MEEAEASSSSRSRRPSRSCGLPSSSSSTALPPPPEAARASCSSGAFPVQPEDKNIEAQLEHLYALSNAEWQQLLLMAGDKDNNNCISEEEEEEEETFTGDEHELEEDGKGDESDLDDISSDILEMFITPNDEGEEAHEGRLLSSEEDEEKAEQQEEEVEVDCWKKYLARSGCLPATSGDGALFRHDHEMRQTVGEKLFPPDSLVLVRTEDGLCKEAVVEASVVDLLTVRTVEDEEQLTISIDDVISDAETIEKHVGPEHSSLFSTLEPEYADRLDRPVYEFIQVGDYFEIQAEEDPRQVSIAVVVNNLAGLVEYRTPNLADRKGKKELNKFIHFSSWRVHPLSWAIQYSDDLEYANADDGLVREAEKSAVPLIAFSLHPRLHSPLPPHSLVELLQPPSVEYPSGHFSPTIFTRPLADHMGVFTVFSKDIKHSEEILLPLDSGLVFPPMTSAARRFPILFPRFLEGVMTEEEDDLDGPPTVRDQWNLLRIYIEGEFERNRLKTGKEVPECRFALSEDLPFHDSDSDAHCEGSLSILINCVHRPYLVPARVRQRVGPLLVVVPDGWPDSRPPLLLPANSTALFPADYAAASGIPLRPPSLKHLARMEKSLHNFVTTPNPIFTGRHEKTPKFVPKAWASGDVWLPEVYVNHECVVNERVFSRAKLLRLPLRLGPGPLHLIVQKIINLLYRVAKDKEYFLDAVQGPRDCVRDALNTNYVKKQGYVETVNYVTCETTSQFPRWISELLIRLDSCPSFIGLEPAISNRCPADCALKRAQLVERLQVDEDSVSEEIETEPPKRYSRPEYRKKPPSKPAVERRNRAEYREREGMDDAEWTDVLEVMQSRIRAKHTARHVMAWKRALGEKDDWRPPVKKSREDEKSAMDNTSTDDNNEEDEEEDEVIFLEDSETGEGRFVETPAGTVPKGALQGPRHQMSIQKKEEEEGESPDYDQMAIHAGQKQEDDLSATATPKKRKHSEEPGDASADILDANGQARKRRKRRSKEEMIRVRAEEQRKREERSRKKEAKLEMQKKAVLPILAGATLSAEQQPSEGGPGVEGGGEQEGETARGGESRDADTATVDAVTGALPPGWQSLSTISSGGGGGGGPPQTAGVKPPLSTKTSAAAAARVPPGVPPVPTPTRPNPTPQPGTSRGSIAAEKQQQQQPWMNQTRRPGGPITTEQGGPSRPPNPPLATLRQAPEQGGPSRGGPFPPLAIPSGLSPAASQASRSSPRISMAGPFPRQDPESLQLPSDPMEWTSAEAAMWMRDTFGIKETVDVLASQDLDGMAILSLTENACMDLGLRAGPAINLLGIIKAMTDARRRQFH